MKSFFPALFMALTLAACNHSDRQLIDRISVADSIAINYYRGDGTMDTVVAVRIIRDPGSIERMAGLVGERVIDYNRKCGYDGSLHFFKMNQVIEDIDFGMAGQGCSYFSFKEEGRIKATALSAEAKELIESFRK
jgi:hypothetical protein